MSVKLKLVKALAKDYFNNMPKVTTADKIIDIICQEYKVSRDAMCERNRKREIVEPRQIAQYFIKTKTAISLHETGRIFNRDHATCINSIKIVNNLIYTDKLFKAKIEELERKINEQK